jgi:hypothetical protein
VPFLPCAHFQPSLIFAVKAETLYHNLPQLSPCFKRISYTRLKISFPGTNALAYLACLQITERKVLQECRKNDQSNSVNCSNFRKKKYLIDKIVFLVAQFFTIFHLFILRLLLRLPVLIFY